MSHYGLIIDSRCPDCRWAPSTGSCKTKQPRRFKYFCQLWIFMHFIFLSVENLKVSETSCMSLLSAFSSLKLSIFDYSSFGSKCMKIIYQHKSQHVVKITYKFECASWLVSFVRFKVSFKKLTTIKHIINIFMGLM